MFHRADRAVRHSHRFCANRMRRVASIMHLRPDCRESCPSHSLLIAASSGRTGLPGPNSIGASREARQCSIQGLSTLPRRGRTPGKIVYACNRRAVR